MPAEAAPLYSDLAGDPPGGHAAWLETEDGVRVRVAHWVPEGAAKGTVFAFAGRTEYIEKYGPAAGEFVSAGYAMTVIDWRGQGASDRLLPDGRLGHVDSFSDYQLDVDAWLAHAEALSLPKPWMLLGHSMGGAIGLRTLVDGSPMAGAVFSGPMWGVRMDPAMKLMSILLPSTARLLGLDHHKVPLRPQGNYVEIKAFEDNTWTQDPTTWENHIRFTAAHPDIWIGQPTIRWGGLAIAEAEALYRAPRPTVPCLTVVGSQESITDLGKIRRMHENWPSGTLIVVEGARHEIMTELPDLRSQFFAHAIAHFDQVAAGARHQSSD